MLSVAGGRRAAGSHVLSLVLRGQFQFISGMSNSAARGRLSNDITSVEEERRQSRRRRIPRGEAAKVRERRSLENAKVQRFQPFGKAGGEGGKVAEGMLERFGAWSSAPLFSQTSGTATITSKERKGKLKWLEEELEIRLKGVEEMVKREPRIAQQSPEAISERLAWLRDRLRLTEEQVRSLVHRKPSLLCRSIEDGMEFKVRWLQDTMGLDDDKVALMVTSAPNVLSASVKGGMEAKIEWLSKRLRLSREELSRVVSACPQMLTSSIEDALEPRLKWIQDTLQIGDRTLRERVLTHPWLLNLSKEGKLEPTIEFLRDELRMEEVDVKKTLFRQPRMFLTPLRPALASTTAWLQQGLGMSDGQALDVVRKEARLLLRSAEVLQSKVDFFKNEMGATLEDIREVVLSSPNVLLVSIDLVLEGRVEAMRRAGVEPCFALHWNSMAFGPAGEDFDDWVAKQGRRPHRRGKFVGTGKIVS